MAFTTEQKLALTLTAGRYREALLLGDNDLIADTSENLDAVVSALVYKGFENDPILMDLISTYDDEQDFGEAAAKIDEVLAALA